jgi:two-component system chemotaxis response regulator CheB
MNGLEFLDRLMRLRPMPVVMISGATRRNSEATITALRLGAVDCILKPSSRTAPEMEGQIARRVFAAAECRVIERRRVVRHVPQGELAQTRPERQPLVLIGASTGGVTALDQVLGDLYPKGPPVVIVQHMPGAFLASFTKELNRKLPQEIALARAGEPLRAGQIRVAPEAGKHTLIQRENGLWRCDFQSRDEGDLHCPSVNHLFSSAVPFAREVIAVILTGLGRDGASGMAALRREGARTLGQDAVTATVYGMPRAAFELGAVERQLPISRIGTAINELAVQYARQGGGPGR